MNHFRNFLIYISISTGLAAQAVSLEESSGRFYEYDRVNFTNPVCKSNKYKNPIKSFSGDILKYTPKDVFCDYSDAAKYNPENSSDIDFLIDVKKDNYGHPQLEQILDSPQFQLLDWINHTTKEDEIIMAYLSFSNQTIKKALCSAAKRGVGITFFLDKKKREISTSGTIVKTLGDELADCSRDNKPTVFERGKSSTIGYHHFKITIIKKKKLKEDQLIKLAFGSGNMSSGPYLHHENWNFIGTNTSSYFAKVHLCVLELLIDEKIANSKSKFRSGVKSCRSGLKGEEEDIKTYFVPGEGEKATKVIASNISKAAYIDIAAHRFSYRALVNALKDRGRNARSNEFGLRMVFDDDLFWVGQKPVFMQGHDKEVTDKYAAAMPNGANEYRVVKDLVENLTKYGSDAEVRYMQTNPDKHMLHHNKFIVFRDSSQRAFAVFAGAGNFTTTAFSYNARYKPNFENYYFITIPEIVSDYEKQFERLWKLSTAAKDLPSKAPFISEILK